VARRDCRSRAPCGRVGLVDTPTEAKPGTVYFRSPSNYLEPATTLLAVLRKLLVRPTVAAASA
jgi:hypothetical protein